MKLKLGDWENFLHILAPYKRTPIADDETPSSNISKNL
jgi:hypothetical protein